MADKLDLSGFAARAPRTPPPKRRPHRAEPAVDEPAPGTSPDESETAQKPPMQRRSPQPSKRTPSTVTGPGKRITINVPIGLRRWLRTFGRAVGLAHHEVVLEAVDRHADTLRRADPRASRPIEDGVRIDLYLQGSQRARVEDLATELGWTVSETVSELLQLERRSVDADPQAVAQRLARRLTENLHH